MQPAARKSLESAAEPELTLRSAGPGTGDGPHPHLVEFVRALARQAAKEWHGEQTALHTKRKNKERLQQRS